MNDPENNQYMKKEIPGRVFYIGAVLAGVGLLLGFIAFMFDRTRSSYNVLIAFMFLMSIGVGSLFLVALEYIAGAVWSTPFRRVPELLSSMLFVLPFIAVILLLNSGDLFHWAHHEAVEHDAVLKAKSPYLNVTFFAVRTAVVLMIWLLFYFLMLRNSRAQDKSGDTSFSRKNIKLSAVFMPVFAITITISAIDWMMSLEPHWFSTIFGVYYFAGTLLAALAATTLVSVLLKENGFLHPGLVEDHYYSLGALMFGFVNFWAYIAFSQFLLIWYANLPEENFWFLLRWQNSWRAVSVVLLLAHFIVPYFLLLSQPAKMNPRRLILVSIWILCAHLLDIYWLVMPAYGRNGMVFGWMEIAFPVAIAGIIMLLFSYKARKTNLTPVGDPKLKSGLNFRL